jgi:TPR repeat protein
LRHEITLTTWFFALISNHLLDCFFQRSIYNLAQMHLHGLGTVANCAVAVRLLKTVAERGDWATILKDAHGDYVRGHDRKALMLYLQAAEEGFEVAQNNAAWLLERIGSEGGLHEDGVGGSDLKDVLPNARARRALALRYWQRAAEQGNAEAQRKVGDYLFYGWAAAALNQTSASQSIPDSAAAGTSSASAGTSSPSTTSTPLSDSSKPEPASSTQQPESQSIATNTDVSSATESTTTTSTPTATAATETTAKTTESDTNTVAAAVTADEDEQSWVVPDFEAAAQAYLAAAETRNAHAMFNVG